MYTVLYICCRGISCNMNEINQRYLSHTNNILKSIYDSGSEYEISILIMYGIDSGVFNTSYQLTKIQIDEYDNKVSISMNFPLSRVMGNSFPGCLMNNIHIKKFTGEEDTEDEDESPSSKRQATKTRSVDTSSVKKYRKRAPKKSKDDDNVQAGAKRRR
jgi:hypothetical protein